MKKNIPALFLALVLILSLPGCGAARTETLAADAENPYAAAGTAEAPSAPSADAAGGVGAEAAPEAGGTAVYTDKIIYSGYAEIETQDFDESVSGVSALLDRFGGFLESSSVTGRDYYSGYGGRTARFTIRVPAERFRELTQALSELGNVTLSGTDAQNITREYNDTQARLDAYNIEYERLLAMLEKAETVEDMLSIESRLSDVRGSIQSLSNTISGWDSLLTYSTVQLQLTEVVDYTEEPEPEESYWQSVWSGFVNSLESVGRFFKNLLRALVTALPVLAIAAAVGAAAWVITRRIVRRRREGMPQPKNDEKDGKNE